MRPKGKNRCQTLPPDVLSDLPENLIDAILMRLPFRDAVKTSILSKKWRYSWCRLPELLLDKTVWETRKGLVYRANKITKIISHILILHAGPITKFTLCVPTSRHLEIDDLIYFLSRNGIQHLVLRLTGLGKRYELCSSLFTCLQLRHLTLAYCLVNIPPPPEFKGFDRLISLELCEVKISAKLLGSLISNCSLLEHLVLYHISSSNDVIEINAPMLRSFDFIGCIDCICLKNIPLLAKFSLEAMPSEKWARVDIVKFFESFSALEHLLLNIMSFAEEVDEVPRRLPFNLNRVKQLYIPCIDMFGMKDFSCALCLIRSFPCLEYMKIQGFYFTEDEDEDEIPALECLEVEHCSDVTLDHLREVELKLANGSTVQDMQLVKLLLAKSPVLERMLLVVCQSATVKILNKLLEFHRASPKAEVVIAETSV